MALDDGATASMRIRSGAGIVDSIPLPQVSPTRAAVLDSPYVRCPIGGSMKVIMLACICLAIWVTPVVSAQIPPGSAQPSKTPATVPIAAGPQPAAHRTPALAPTRIPQSMGAKRATVTPPSVIKPSSPNSTSPVGLSAGPGLRAPSVTPTSAQTSPSAAPATKASTRPRLVLMQPAKP